MGNSSTKQGSEIGRSKRLALNLRTPTLSSRADFTHAAHGDLIDPTDNQADIVDVVNTVQSLGTADTDFDTVPQAQRCPKSLNAPSTQPLVFFANQGNSDPYFLYNTALIFKRNGKYFEAREKLRETLKYKSAIADDARLHLAQCLVALDPFLKSCRTELLDLLCVHRNERESQCFTGMEDNNRNGEVTTFFVLVRFMLTYRLSRNYLQMCVLAWVIGKEHLSALLTW